MVNPEFKQAWDGNSNWDVSNSNWDVSNSRYGSNRRKASNNIDASKSRNASRVVR
jgi:hypothetical protein